MGNALKAAGYPFLFLLAFSAACSSKPPDLTIHRVDILMRVLPDGSADVTENWAFLPGTTAASEFVPDVPSHRHDGASEIHRELNDTTGTMYELRVRYRIHGLVGVAGLRGSLRWAALGSGAAVPIGHVAFTLALPDDAPLIEGPAAGEAGWTITPTPRGMMVSRDAIPARGTATINASFVIDQMSMAKPRWQYQEERAAEFVPAFISAGLFILVIGAGVLAMMRFRFARGGGTDDSEPLKRSDRMNAARDLRRSGIVALIVGILATAATARMPGGFGPWAYSIGVSVVIVGISFIVLAPRFRPR